MNTVRGSVGGEQKEGSVPEQGKALETEKYHLDLSLRDQWKEEFLWSDGRKIQATVGCG